jgi:hypothetical protein
MGVTPRCSRSWPSTTERAKLAQERGRLLDDAGAPSSRPPACRASLPRLRHGDIVEAVEELEADADLIVIGKRGEAADFAKMHLGSNLERVVRVSRKPVLVASRAFKPIKRFLVAFDGGPSAMKAIDHIARDPIFAGLECQVLTVGADAPETRKRRWMMPARCCARPPASRSRTGIVQGQADAVIAEACRAPTRSTCWSWAPTATRASAASSSARDDHILLIR